MSIYAGIGSADPTQGGNNLRPGQYELLLRGLKSVTSRKNGREHFVALFEVLSATKTDDKIEPNGVGSKPSWVVNMQGEYPELALGNVKAFLHAAYNSLMTSMGEAGPTMEQVDEALTLAALNEDENPLGGVRVTCDAWHKETNKGTLFTRTDWGVPEDVAEEARAS